MSNIRWISGQDIFGWHPFDYSNEVEFCILKISFFEKKMPNGPFLSVADNINIEDAISNEQFIDYCKNSCPINKLTKIFTYVQKEDWNDFIDTLSCITNGKEYYIDYNIVKPHLKNPVNYFKYFTPFRPKINTTGEHYSIGKHLDGIYIHYEELKNYRPGKFYTTQNPPEISIDTLDDEKGLTPLSFLNEIRKKENCLN